MSKLLKGTTFTTGVPATAADLNNLVDAASILPGAVTEQTTITPATGDLLLAYDVSGSALGKFSVQDVIDVFPTDAAAGNKSLRTLGTTATQAAAGNDTRFPSSVTGIRKGAGAGSTDAAAAPKDFIFTPNNLSGSSTIDWDLADVFYDTLSANRTYTFTNVRAGRVIVLQLNQNGHTVAFPAGWILLGTANTASWNIYSLVNSAVASLISVSS